MITGTVQRAGLGGSFSPPTFCKNKNKFDKSSGVKKSKKNVNSKVAVFSWLRSRMNQERFSNLTVLNIHKERTDRLSTIDIANEFIFSDRNTNRKRNFGTFRVNDVQ